MQRPITLAPQPGAIKTRYLHDIVMNIKSRLYPATCVIASITGVTASAANDALRHARFDARWLDFSYTPPIKWARGSEIEQALRLVGYVGHWRRLPDRPTLAAYLDARIGAERDHPCVVFLTTHCVAVSGGLFCDVFSNGEVVDIDDAKGRRKRVERVFVVTGRVTPTPIATRAPLQTKTRAETELERLFREAIRAETGALRVKLTPSEVFVIRPNETGWTWLGNRDGIEDQILMRAPHHRLLGTSEAAAAYRTAMDA